MTSISSQFADKALSVLLILVFLCPALPSQQQFTCNRIWCW